MHSIQVHKVIHQIICLLHRIDFWHRGDKATIKELSIKTFYYIFYFFFFIALLVGAINGENQHQSVFVGLASLVIFVMMVKIYILIWQQKRILELLSQISVSSIRRDDEVAFANEKLKKFAKFVVFGITLTSIGIGGAVIVMPIVNSEKMLFLKIAFPLDWRKNDIAYWMAFTFLLIGCILTITALLFNVIMWYLMMNCSIRYQVLGRELRHMGQMDANINLKISEQSRQNLYSMNLQAAIDSHLHIQNLVGKAESFFSSIFLVQLATGAISIGAAIYLLAFVTLSFTIPTMNVADILSITYFGNEIVLSSNGLSYCLFESDCVEQPRSTKNCVIIFGEHLKQPHQIIVGKLYPLTFETFKKILNSAYSMFNILNKAKK